MPKAACDASPAARWRSWRRCLRRFRPQIGEVLVAFDRGRRWSWNISRKFRARSGWPSCNCRICRPSGDPRQRACIPGNRPADRKRSPRGRNFQIRRFIRIAASRSAYRPDRTRPSATRAHDVVLQSDAQRSVIPGGPDPAVNFGIGKDEAAPFARLTIFSMLDAAYGVFWKPFEVQDKFVRVEQE